MRVPRAEYRTSSKRIARLSRRRFDRLADRRQVGRIRDRSVEFQFGRAIRATDCISPAALRVYATAGK